MLKKIEKQSVREDRIHLVSLSSTIVVVFPFSLPISCTAQRQFDCILAARSSSIL
jgi:hypothetical protein